MTQERLELRFAPPKDGSDWAELVDENGRMHPTELAGMAAELREFYKYKPQSTSGTIRFKSPAGGLPADWQLIPDAGSSTRGHFVRLRPVNEPTVESEPAKGKTDRRDKPHREEIVPFFAASESKPSGASGRTADDNASLRRLERGAQISTTPAIPNPFGTGSQQANVQAGQIPLARTIRAITNDDTKPDRNGKSGGERCVQSWQLEFVADVRRVLQDSPRQEHERESDRLLQTETLENVERLVRRHPDQVTLILYHGLVESMSHEAKEDGRNTEQNRLQIVLNHLEQLCCDAFLRQVEQNQARGPSDSTDRPGRCWVAKLLGYLLSRLNAAIL